MAETIVELLTDVADAIREKKGTSESINAQSFAEEIRTIESGNGWTGHADVEGLKAIGWDDEDIAYYQKYGVNWNEEDDMYHKVTDDNKALYGVLTASNIQTYRDRIVYLPKIDMSQATNLDRKFQYCYAMVAMPIMNIPKVTSLRSTFYNCTSLTCLSIKDTSNVTDIAYMLDYCYSLVMLSPMNFENVTSMTDAFNGCNSLTHMFSFNFSKVTNMQGFGCRSVVVIDDIDALSATSFTLQYCSSLRYVNIRNLSTSLSLIASALLSKDSLLYMIENESATEAITITLHSYAYQRLAEDTDSIEALNNHPLVSLASA